MDINTLPSYMGEVITIVASFLFGVSGLVPKFFNFLFDRNKKKREEEEQEEREKDLLFKQQEERIAHMSASIDTLKETIITLEKDLIKTSTYVKTLLVYLENLMPEGANPFIKEIAKAIREK